MQVGRVALPARTRAGAQRRVVLAAAGPGRVHCQPSARGLSTPTTQPPADERDDDPYNALVTRFPLANHHHSVDPSLPLSGLTASIKHNFLTAAHPSTAASRMLLTNFRPHFDATAVRLLRDAGGASLVGKTNCDEFGMGSENVHSVYGPALHPHYSSTRRRAAGGSSGGAAAATASGQCDLSLASDTGGSIRLPASYCGVWGLKPSYGRISRWGLIAYADSLDTVGLLGRELEPVRRAYGVLDSVDARDPTAVGRAYRSEAERLVSARLAQIGGGGGGGGRDDDARGRQRRPLPLAGMVIGVPREYFPAELSRAVVRVVRQTLRRLKAAGATLRSVSLPHTERSLGAYYVLASAEAASNLARYDGIRYGFRKESDPADLAAGEHPYAATRSAGFGPEVQRRILVGTYALSAGAFDNYFLKAQRIRRLVQADFDRVFALPNVLRRDASSSPTSAPTPNGSSTGVDVLIHPSAVGIAPLLPEASDEGKATTASSTSTSTSASSYVQDVLTVPASLAGLPALSMPVGLSSGSCSGSAEAGDEQGEEEEDTE
ncbi:Trimeric GatFAB AmidoTransferase(AdT) complex subunit, partial [Tilletia horrida]